MTLGYKKGESYQGTNINLPVWLVTILIGVFLALIGLLFNSIDNRLNRIETKLDQHIMISNSPMQAGHN
jgi:Flp pilus assembly protein protease CpaA